MAGIMIANLLFFSVFAKQLSALGKVESTTRENEESIPKYITAIHLIAIVWTVFVAHYPSLVVIGVAGAVAGGGLTVIANAPNPAGQSILQSYFGPGGINPLGLLLAATIPTLIVGAALMLLP